MNRRLNDMPITGCYHLDVYCEDEGLHSIAQKVQREHMGTFTGRNRREAIQEARATGWSINDQKRTAYCPSCVARRASK